MNITEESKEIKLMAAKDLWNNFDVPIDKNECIEEEWQHFPAGTHREEIWHWFEEVFEVSVAKDLMNV